MKLLFLDFCFFRGHHNLNIKLLEILSKKYEVEVISKSGYYSESDKFKLMNVAFNEYNFSFLNIKSGPLINRLKIAIIMIITALKIRKRRGKLFVVGFENITYGILGILFRNNNTYLIHHQNTDELTNKLKYKIFSSYKNKVNHVGLDQFIAEYLVENIRINSEKVFYINHPIAHTNEKVIEYQNIQCDKKIFVGLSGSNDESIIENLIKDSKSGRLKMDKNVKIIVKSKKFNYESESLTVFNKYLSNEEYDDYIKNAFGFLLLFPKDFQHRMSGTLIDSLKSKRIVIGTDIPCVKAFNSRYPKICYTISDFNDMDKISTDKLYNNPLNSEFEKFKENHSDSMILKQFERMFGD